MGFEESIGISIRGLHKNWEYELEQDELFDVEHITRLQIAIRKYKSSIESSEGQAWISREGFGSRSIEQQDLVDLVKYENDFKKLKLFKSLEIYFRKNESTFHFRGASSGELIYLASSLFIAAYISDRSVILIDEPEVSLHPEWQNFYVKGIFDQFEYFHPTLVIATHSPLIISGSEVFERARTKVLKAENFSFNEVPRDSLNIEELLWDVFGYVGPESTFLSRHFIEKIHELSKGAMTQYEFDSDLRQFSSKSNDPRQREALAEIANLALKVTENG